MKDDYVYKISKMSMLIRVLGEKESRIRKRFSKIETEEGNVMHIICLTNN